MHMSVLIKLLALYPRDAHVPLDLLVLFGASVPDIAAMKVAVFSKVPDLERALAALDRRTYALVFAFFRACSRRSLYYEIPGDAAMYASHCNALSVVYKTVPGHPYRGKLPAVAGRLQACDNCGDVKHASFYTREVKNKHSDGKGNVMMTGDAEVVCACRPQNADWRELYKLEHGECPPSLEKKKAVRSTADTLKRKFAKRVAMQTLYRACQQTQTRRINALGRVAVYMGVPYVACFHDLRVAPLERMRYRGDQILCYHCDEGGRGGAPPNPPKGGLAAPPNPPSGTSMRARDNPGGGVRGGPAPLCEYCEKEVAEEKRREFFLVDDKDPLRPEFRSMWFCKSHGPLAWVNGGGYTHRSDVIRGLIERWETIGSDGRAIPCGRGFGFGT
jgi:hypothetical protein